MRIIRGYFVVLLCIVITLSYASCHRHSKSTTIPYRDQNQENKP